MGLNPFKRSNTTENQQITPTSTDSSAAPAAMPVNPLPTDNGPAVDAGGFQAPSLPPVNEAPISKSVPGGDLPSTPSETSAPADAASPGFGSPAPEPALDTPQDTPMPQSAPQPEAAGLSTNDMMSTMLAPASEAPANDLPGLAVDTPADDAAAPAAPAAEASMPSPETSDAVKTESTAPVIPSSQPANDAGMPSATSIPVSFDAGSVSASATPPAQTQAPSNTAVPPAQSDTTGASQPKL